MLQPPNLTALLFTSNEREVYFSLISRIRDVPLYTNPAVFLTFLKRGGGVQTHVKKIFKENLQVKFSIFFASKLWKTP